MPLKEHSSQKKVHRVGKQVYNLKKNSSPQLVLPQPKRSQSAMKKIGGRSICHKRYIEGREQSARQRKKKQESNVFLCRLTSKHACQSYVAVKEIITLKMNGHAHNCKYSLCASSDCNFARMTQRTNALALWQFPHTFCCFIGMQHKQPPQKDSANAGAKPSKTWKLTIASCGCTLLVCNLVSPELSNVTCEQVINTDATFYSPVIAVLFLCFGCRNYVWLHACHECHGSTPKWHSLWTNIVDSPWYMLSRKISEFIKLWRWTLVTERSDCPFFSYNKHLWRLLLLTLYFNIRMTPLTTLVVHEQGEPQGPRRMPEYDILFCQRHE